VTTSPTTSLLGGSALVTIPNVALGVPSALQCYTWPDGAVTQTFDPQSPPCVASWPGAAAGNGGATTPGVTGTAIRVGVNTDVSTKTQGIEDSLVDFFNSHYEFFGRHLQLVNVPGNTETGPPFEKAQADAEQEAKVFIANDITTGVADDSTYLAELARDRVIGVSDGGTYETSEQLAGGGPYLWSVTPVLDTLETDLGSEICAQLVGGDATHSQTFKTARRTFGVLVPNSLQNGGAPSPEISSLTGALRGCGVTPAVAYYEGQDGAGEDALTQLFAQWEAKPVTSVILLDDPDDTSGQVFPIADALAYRPEWLMAGTGVQDDPLFWQTGVSDQNAQVFGVLRANKPLPIARTIAYQAGEAADPAFDQVSAGFGESFEVEALYDFLQFVSAGVQAAGPDLTPQTFATQLTALDFPDPGAGQPPYYQGGIGFGTNHTMIDDVALAWWDLTGTNESGASGAFCLIGNGRRWTAGDWPAGDPGFFNQAKGC